MVSVGMGIERLVRVCGEGVECDDDGVVVVDRGIVAAVVWSCCGGSGGVMMWRERWQEGEG